VHIPVSVGKSTDDMNGVENMPRRKLLTIGSLSPEGASGGNFAPLNRELVGSNGGRLFRYFFLIALSG
jgi:hypothetical protein